MEAMAMNKIWLKKCFDVAELLYCVYPYEVLEELYMYVVN